jgi:hypothetical protein
MVLTISNMEQDALQEGIPPYFWIPWRKVFEILDAPPEDDDLIEDISAAGLSSSLQERDNASNTGGDVEEAVASAHFEEEVVSELFQVQVGHFVTFCA